MLRRLLASLVILLVLLESTDFADAPAKYPVIIIDKSELLLRVYTSPSSVKDYKVALGLDPVSDKKRQGDCATPEGRFYICTKNPKSRYHLFLGISYPNEEDAERGLRDSLITEDEYRSIIKSLEEGETPLWDTALGGKVGIHGGGIRSNWTWGCIAMTNKNIEEVYCIAKIGTPVIIRR